MNPAAICCHKTSSQCSPFFGRCIHQARTARAAANGWSFCNDKLLKKAQSWNRNATIRRHLYRVVGVIVVGVIVVGVIVVGVIVVGVIV
jgi:hypothetical protein